MTTPTTPTYPYSNRSKHPLVTELITRIAQLPTNDAAQACTAFIAAANGTVPKVRRAIIAAWAAEGLSKAEVARRLGITPGAVHHLWPQKDSQ